MLQAKLRSNVLAHVFTMARFSHSVFSLKVSSSGTTASSPEELISHTSPRSSFLHEMNQTSHCSTRDCSGILLALRKLTGLQARLSRESFTRDRLPKTTTVNGTPSFSAASQIPRSMWTMFSRETHEKTKNLLLLNWNFFLQHLCLSLCLSSAPHPTVTSLASPENRLPVAFLLLLLLNWIFFPLQQLCLSLLCTTSNCYKLSKTSWKMQNRLLLRICFFLFFNGTFSPSICPSLSSASNCDKLPKSCFVWTTPKFTPAVRTLQIAFRNSTIAKDLKHIEETTRLQTNKQRGRQDCNEHETRKDREAEGKKNTSCW